MEQISTVILCGGQSRRMGCDKANLVFGKKTFLECIYDQCSSNGDVFIAVGENDSHYLYSKGVHIKDEYKNCGPLGGIHKALSEMQGEWLFVVACDMPIMDFEFAHHMYKKIKNHPDVVVPVDSAGRRHTIGGLYHKNIIKALEIELKNGNYKMLNFLEKLLVQYVPIEGSEEQKLLNINHYDAYERFLKEQIPQ